MTRNAILKEISGDLQLMYDTLNDRDGNVEMAYYLGCVTTKISRLIEFEDIEAMAIRREAEGAKLWENQNHGR